MRAAIVIAIPCTAGGTGVPPVIAIPCTRGGTGAPPVIAMPRTPGGTGLPPVIACTHTMTGRMPVLPAWLVACALVAWMLVASSACVTKSGTPVAFAASTFHESAPLAGSFKRGERVRGESCEKALVFIEMNGAPLGIRLDDGAIPRDIDAALSDAEAKCKGCSFLANVSVDTERRSQCLGLLIEECTIVKGAAMFAVPAPAGPAVLSAPAYPE